MTEYCSYCGGYSRGSCSFYYSGASLENELRTCGNLSDGRRSGALYSAGFTRSARELEEIEELRRENEDLRHRLGQ